MRVGPIRYNETEERVIVRSWILGVLGLPLGSLVGIYLSFLRAEVPHDPLGLFIATTPLFAIICGFWWLTTVIFSFVFWRKANAYSLKSVGKILFPTAVIPLSM
jgi:hypothetical protein